MKLNMMFSSLYSNGLLSHLISHLWDIVGEQLTKICVEFSPNVLLKVSLKELRHFLRQKEGGSQLFTSKGAANVVAGECMYTTW